MKIIPLRKLRLFILAIVVISGICSASAAFLGGVANIQFVLGEEENVVLITAPGVTTPITSVIPVFPAAALRDCTGIKFVSPETLSINILYLYVSTIFNLYWGFIMWFNTGALGCVIY